MAKTSLLLLTASLISLANSDVNLNSSFPSSTPNVTRTISSVTTNRQTSTPITNQKRIVKTTFEPQNIEISTQTKKPVSSVKDICRLFNLPLWNCTCKNYPDWCDGQEEFKPTAAPSHTFNRTNTNWYAALTVIISLVGILANLAVLVVTYTSRKRMHRSNLLIALLSLFDLIFCLLLLVEVVPLFWTVKWSYGLVMCKIIRGIEVFSSLISIEIMVVIAIDRFLVLIFHLRIKYSMQKISGTLLGCAVSIAIASVVPYMISLGIDEVSGRCFEMWSGGKTALLGYQWFIMVCFYIVPVIGISATYGHLMRYLTRQLTSSSLVNTEKMMKKRVKHNRRIMRLLMSVMVAFIVFTLPNKAIWIYTSSKTSVPDGLYTALMFVSLLTYPLHSVVNPFIYSVVDKNFRRDLSQLTIERFRSGTETTIILDKL